MFVGEQQRIEMRQLIETYDFDSMHSAMKDNWGQHDTFLFYCSETALLLWFGDVAAALKGWWKSIHAWKEIEKLVQAGERTWSEYAFEGILLVPTVMAGMLAANETGLMRELMQHVWMGAALRDPLAAAELEKTLKEFAYAKWEVLSLFELPQFCCLPSLFVASLLL